MCIYLLLIVEMTDFTYEAWKEYLKSDREMNAKWKSLTKLWENVKKSLKENLDSLPYSEALKRRRMLTARNIFNVINTAKERPNFNWHQKLIYNEEDERHEYVIQCLNPSSDYIFRKIKEERGVASMFGESINKYLQPVTDKIWALKKALQVSIQPEAQKEDLSYESLKMNITSQTDEWAENHYGWNDRDVVDENGDVILNPEYENISVEYELPEMEEDWQLKIPFYMED